MAASPNLKVGITAETSQFDRGMKEAQQNLRTFEKVGSSAIDAIGQKLGVNVGAIKNFSEAAQGALQKIGGASGTAASAVASIGAACPVVATAFVAMGAVIAAQIKAMKDDVEEFYKLAEGQEMKQGTEAFISTYAQSLRDSRMEQTRLNAELEQTLQKFRAIRRENRQNRRASGFFGAMLGSIESGGADPTLVNVKNQLDISQQQALNNAELAEMYTKANERQFDKIRKNVVEWAKLDAQISSAMRDMKDPSKSLAEQEQARLRAVELINKRYDEELMYRNKILTNQESLSELATDDIEAENLKNEYALKVLATEQKRDALLKSTYEVEKRITNEKEKQIQAAAAANAQNLKALGDLNQKITDDRISYDDQASMMSLEHLSSDLIQSGFQLKVPFKLDLAGSREQVQKDIIDLTGIIEDSFNTLGESLGSLIGDLVTGGDAFANFGKAALTALGDMAITVGRIAISAGIATAGIEAAFKSMNGWPAIAAGVALVALGSAVKAGLGNVANGNYSSSSSVASSTSSSTATADMLEKAIDINVTGTLRGDGKDLLAVIANTGKSNYALGY